MEGVEQGASAPAERSAEKMEAEAYLYSLINKTLRIYAKDGRLFVGAFKCTDPNSNIVLALTYEYRQPSQQKLVEAVAASSNDPEGRVKADMTSRYLGMVVVPGEHIARIEVEEFVSQMKGRSVLERRGVYGHP